VEEVGILFLCIGNTCRSPMAEAIARHLGGDRVRCFSAGLAPTGEISPHTVEALGRLGVPAEGLASKGLEEVPLDEVDVVVSLVGEHGLRFVPAHVGHHREAWEIVDPYGEEPAVYLEVAAELERRVRRLLAELLEEGGEGVPAEAG